MARQELVPQEFTSDGLTPSTEAAVADGHFLPNDGRRVVYVENSGASSVGVTAVIPLTVDGIDVTDKTVSVPAGGSMWLGPYGREYDQDDGSVHIDYADASVLSVAAVEMPHV